MTLPLKKNMKNFPKHVRIDQVPQVKKLVVWQFAAQQARSGQCWLENMIDRDRFKRRIRETEQILEPILIHHLPRD
jgi:hypothetical protein